MEIKSSVTHFSFNMYDFHKRPALYLVTDVLLYVYHVENRTEIENEIAFSR